jgi:hypothetical protein
MAASAPRGYVQFDVGVAHVVCMEHVADAIEAALASGTLYDYAAHHPEARPLVGRAISYAVPLPHDVERAVVRHNRHGGLLAPLTGDVFRTPTRAPLELAISERLRELRVPSPRMLGYVTYPAAPGFARADVVTREVRGAQDLSAALMTDDAVLRERALRATTTLLHALSDAGVRHHDLNVKNVLLQNRDGELPLALLLDVDRVVFGGDKTSVRAANLARLLRSARKWQSLHGARVTDSELAELSAAAQERPSVAASTLS